MEDEIQKLRDANEKLREECTKLKERLSKIIGEKEHLLQKVEEEEEFLTNTLQQKLHNMEQEKVDLENELEQEEEFLTNKLQKMLIEKDQTIRELEAEKELREEKDKELETELQALKETVDKLSQENKNLKSKAALDAETIHRLSKEVANLMGAKEVMEERRFNKSKQRARSYSVPDQNYVTRRFSLPLEDPIVVPRGRGGSRPETDDVPKRTISSPTPSSGIPAVSPASSPLTPLSSTLADLSPNLMLQPSMGHYSHRRSYGALGLHEPRRKKSRDIFLDTIARGEATLSICEELEPKIFSTLHNDKCIKRGWMKIKCQRDDKWDECMAIIQSNKELVICDNDKGKTIRINLDLVTNISEQSDPALSNMRELVLQTPTEKHILSINESEFQEWKEIISSQTLSTARIAQRRPSASTLLVSPRNISPRNQDL